MGRNPKPASQSTGNHLSKTEKELFAKNEKELAGDSERLKKGIEGLNDVELKRFESKGAKDLYDSLAKEASTSSALSNNHIHDLIDLANEYEKLKEYKKLIRKYGSFVFDGIKFSPNPAEKMRKDSLKIIRELKSFLGLSTVDIVTLARQKAEMNESDSLANLFNDDKTNEIWEEK
ncbi:P27 family phage terminase small subunit [Bacillus sp. FSL R7-0642]|uniref:P27 family phage terminase small subunit n=1 Tax=Bacillus sp. FSL R7-0642 TaxID=2921585 RepID=UPI0030F9B18C